MPDAAAPPATVVDASTDAVAIVDAGTPATPAPSFDDVASVLYVDTAKCPDHSIDCLFAARYGDPKTTAEAKSMLDRWQIVAGVERAYTMDGGYRGMIKIEPAVPSSATEKKQLDWIVAAFDDIERFFTELSAHSAGSTTTTPYRWRPLTFRFFKSVGARTPSAYARDWTVAWNFNGSLHVSGDAVRETLVHEIFHLNDAAHHDWSGGALQSIYDGIVKKCGTAIPCLTPYSPAETIVRGGTYYPFQPGNDVREYAAELASRFVREQRAALRKLPPKYAPQGKPFKCGPSENQRAWSAIRDEFFSGIDATPPCP